MLLKGFLQAAPAYIAGQNLLFFRRGGCPSFLLDLMEQTDRSYIGTEFFFCAPGSKAVICDMEIDRRFLLSCSRFSFCRLQRDMVILPDCINRVQRQHLRREMFQFPFHECLVVCLQTL